MSIAILSIIFTSAVLYAKADRTFLLNPFWLFLACQIVVCIGTIFAADQRDVIEQRYLELIGIFLLSLSAGAYFTKSSDNTLQVYRHAVLYSNVLTYERTVLRSIVWIGLISLFISVAYFALTGYNLFLEGITAFVRGDSLSGDVAGRRLETYSGERYLAPGYVNQFKNILYPACVAYLFAKAFLRRDSLLLALTIVLGMIAVAFLLGTGQRGAFVLFALAFVGYVNAAPEFASYRRLFSFTLLGLVLGLFLLNSIIIKRSDLSSLSDNPVQEIVSQVYTRLFESNQGSGLQGFRVTVREETQWGYDWYAKLLGLLPGRIGLYIDDPGYVPIENRVYEAVYGSTRGTAPLSIPGSIHYNFGPIGVPVFGLMIGYALQSLYQRFLGGPFVSFRVLVYALLSAVTGYILGGDPATVMQNGLPAVLVLASVHRYAENRVTKLTLQNRR